MQEEFAPAVCLKICMKLVQYNRAGSTVVRKNDFPSGRFKSKIELRAALGEICGKGPLYYLATNWPRYFACFEQSLYGMIDWLDFDILRGL